VAVLLAAEALFELADSIVYFAVVYFGVHHESFLDGFVGISGLVNSMTSDEACFFTPGRVGQPM
jgi:hypothetical protein